MAASKGCYGWQLDKALVKRDYVPLAIKLLALVINSLPMGHSSAPLPLNRNSLKFPRHQTAD